MSDQNRDKAAAQSRDSGDDPLAADSRAERDRLRERLQQVEVNVSRIDEQYGHSFRDQIREVRRKLEEAERELERSGGEGGRREVWSSLSAEIRDIEGKLRS